jgi:hypothetical protein
MRLPSLRFTARWLMVAVALCGGCFALLRLPAPWIALVVVGSGVCGAILFGVLLDRGRGGWGIKGGVIAGCISLALLFCLFSSISTWYGAKPVSLTFSVVDGSSGRPIPGAEVAVIHPFDEERLPVRGRTAADGRVALRNLFTAYGMMYGVVTTEHVSFRPFMIQVTAEGFSEFPAPLATPDDLSYGKVTYPPLNLTYPVSGPVKITLIRSSDDERRGSAPEPE